MKSLTPLMLTLIVAISCNAARADESWQPLQAKGLNCTQCGQKKLAQAAYEKALSLAQEHNAPASDRLRIVCELAEVYLNQRERKRLINQ